MTLIRNSTVNVRWWFFQAPNSSWYIVDKVGHIYKFELKEGIYDWQQVDTNDDRIEFTVVGGEKRIRVVLVEKPTLTTLTPSITSNLNQIIEVNGEVGTDVYLNSTKVATVPSNGKVELTLPLVTGNNIFSITLKDEDEHESDALTFSIIHDSTPPSITSTSSVNILENIQTVLTVIATDLHPPINYQILGGVDQGKFDINATTGEITFKDTPHCQTTQQNFSIDINVTDIVGNESIQTLTVIVDPVPTRILKVHTEDGVSIDTFELNETYNENIVLESGTLIVNGSAKILGKLTQKVELLILMRGI